MMIGSGFGSTKRKELSNVVNIHAPIFNSKVVHNTSEQFAYLSALQLVCAAKLGGDKDIKWGIKPTTGLNPNGLYTIYASDYKVNATAVPLNPNLAGYTALHRATTDWVCAPYVVKASTNGDVGTSAFTGGWHGSNGDFTGSATARQISMVYLADGINRTIENNVILNVADVKLIVTNRVQGYNTKTTAREILEEVVTFNIIRGIINIEVVITALEDVVIEKYYGLQMQGDAASWNTSVFFYDSEKARITFNKDCDSGFVYNNKISTVNMRGVADLFAWIDNTYGIGNREYVDELQPSFFSINSSRKTYSNLVNGIPLSLKAGESVKWRGGYFVRWLDADRI